MKNLGFFTLLILLCGLSGTAKAFQFSIQDPDIGSFEVFANTPFTFEFGECQLGEAADGCFYAVNKSGAPLTSLDVTFADTAALGSQAAVCDTDVDNGSEFSSAPTCGHDPSDTTYELLFTGPPGIPKAGFFTLEETGIPADEFPEVTADASGLGASAPVPEPGSIALLSSGTVILGVLLFRRKREGFASLV